MTRRRLWRTAVPVLLAGLLTSCALIEGGPEARLDVAPVVVYAGQAIELDASASTGPAPIVSYAWDLGNGTTSAGQVVTATYQEPGIYFVRLTVRDSAGRADEVEQQITVYLQSGTVLFEEDFAEGPEALGHWPLDPTWATDGDATVDHIAAEPGYALYIHSANARWHRRYTAVSIPPLRVGQSVVISCRIMTLQNQDDHTFLFSPARRDLDSIAGSLPYYLFTGTGGGSFVREPSAYGTDVPRPISFVPEVYRWHTYTFAFRSGAYELRIDEVPRYTGPLSADFSEPSDWILLVGEESLTEACVAYFDDIVVSVEE